MTMTQPVGPNDDTSSSTTKVAKAQTAMRRPSRKLLNEVAVIQKRAIHVILTQFFAVPIGVILAAMFLEVAISREAAVRMRELLTTFSLFTFTVVNGIVGMKFARLTRKSSRSFFILLSWIPCLSGLALLIMSMQANRVFKANGIKVGLMGASLEDIESSQLPE